MICLLPPPPPPPHPPSAAAAPGATKAGRLAQFRALLGEAGVNGFSFYDKVRPKLEKDERCAGGEPFLGGRGGRGETFEGEGRGQRG